MADGVCIDMNVRIDGPVGQLDRSIPLEAFVLAKTTLHLHPETQFSIAPFRIVRCNS